MAMEEKKQKRLTYDELNKAASELHVQYQKLYAEYEKAMEALRNRDFDYTSFFLQMLFKVMEHPDMYTEKFVKWASGNIESALVAFAESAHQQQEEEKKEPKDEA